MPSFQNPAAFLLLIFVPLLYIVRYLKIFSGISFPLTFCDWNGERFEWLGGIHGILSAISEFILALSYVCAVIALASPVVRNQEKIYTSRGADIAFVIDTSPSMAAKDIASGTRLEAAKQVVKQLVQQNAGTSFALVAMASEAAVVVPPTTDHNAFLQRLEQLSPGEMGDGRLSPHFFISAQKVHCSCDRRREQCRRNPPEHSGASCPRQRDFALCSRTRHSRNGQP